MGDKSHSTPFTDLVNNALDFFTRSIDEFSTHPKYSVIHLSSAVELFLKARLLLEHWTVILEKPDKADHKAFERGDFRSVGIKEAIKRLDRIADVRLSKQERHCLETIEKHRNQ